MKFNCSIDKITTRQLAIVAVVDSIFVTQSHNCIVDSFDKDVVTFILKANLSKLQCQRLFVDKISFNLPGYCAEMEERSRINYLKVRKDADK